MYLSDAHVRELLGALAERPVNQDDLWIACWGSVEWRSHPIPANIARIAHDLIEAEHSRTILVHGRYGTGKSSFMKSLRAQMDDRVVTTVWADMPSITSHIDSSALAAVMILIAKELQEMPKTGCPEDCDLGQALEDLWVIEARAMRTACNDPCDTTIPPEPNRMVGTERGQGRRFVLANTLERKIEQCIKSMGASKQLVVFLDDLDRCERKVAMDVVRLLLRFGSVSNVHFVLACDWDVLEQGVKDWMHQHGKADDGVPLVTANSALEKYVHIPVELPGMGATAPAWKSKGNKIPDIMRSVLELKSGMVNDEVYREARLYDVLIDALMREVRGNDI